MTTGASGEEDKPGGSRFSNQSTSVLAGIAAASVVGFVALWLLGASPSSVVVACVVALALHVPVIVYAFALMGQLAPGRSGRERVVARAHLLLHVVPASYLLVGLLVRPTFTLNLVYVAPVVAFFWTGRRTWAAVHRQLGSKLYRAFVAGNTALLFWSVVLVALGLVGYSGFGVQGFRRAVTGYFCIHLAITAPVVIKIRNDLARARGLPG